MRSNALKLVGEQEGTSEAPNALSGGAYSLSIFQVNVKGDILIVMRNLLLISALLFSFNGWADDSVIEHFSSEQTIKQDFPFSDAVRVDNTIYISGMIGEDNNGNLVEGGIVPEAHTVMKTMGNILAHFNLGYDDVVKCLVMIDDISEWSMFNSVYVQYFDKPYPARSAFGADGLAGNASFELECIAYIRDDD